jgi:hypothetical protein
MAPCLPTPVILAKIKGRAGPHHRVRQHDGVGSLLSGFLWVSALWRIMLQEAAQFDPTGHLAADNIVMDSRSNPLLLAVTIKQSKTDQFWEGTTYTWARQQIPSTQ